MGQILSILFMIQNVNILWIINKKNGKGNLIYPLNKCTPFQLAGGYFSNKYICNQNNDGIDEIWYQGTECDDNEGIIGNYSHLETETNFNCFNTNITDDNNTNLTMSDHDE